MGRTLICLARAVAKVHFFEQVVQSCENELKNCGSLCSNVQDPTGRAPRIPQMSRKGSNGATLSHSGSVAIITLDHYPVNSLSPSVTSALQRHIEHANALTLLYVRVRVGTALRCPRVRGPGCWEGNVFLQTLGLSAGLRS